MRPSRTRVPARRAGRLLRTAGLAAGLVVLSAGCALRPGVAADVGDASISTSTVDDIAAAVCAVEGPAAQAPLPLASLKGFIVQTLVDERLAKAVAARYDVGPGPDFGEQQRQVASRLADQPADVREDYLAVVRASTYTQAVLAAAAQADLEDRGEDPNDQAALSETAEGLRTLAARDAEIDVAPRYGISYVDGRPTASQAGSVPVSESALAAAASVSGQGDPSYAQSLPDSQTCGG